MSIIFRFSVEFNPLETLLMTKNLCLCDGAHLCMNLVWKWNYKTDFSICTLWIIKTISSAKSTPMLHLQLALSSNEEGRWKPWPSSIYKSHIIAQFILRLSPETFPECFFSFTSSLTLSLCLYTVLHIIYQTAHKDIQYDVFIHSKWFPWTPQS